ncbi:MAG: bifunctional riboflavin kinase/FAD synthetase [Deltaproteobacteria bacterium]|nr:bifunctional riboflavin kinase/FAD synthetase [Deltaproteobacteria bacterium]
MQLIEGIEHIDHPFTNSAITIGNFDGVHLGHKVLIDKVIKKAQEINGPSVVMTFEPHPLKVIKPDKCPPLITTYERKIELIAKTGVDVLISVRFTSDFANVSAEQFVKDILCNTIGMKAILVGPDYTFGKGREGSVDLLKKFSTTCGFDVTVVPWIGPEGERVSSTTVRNLIVAGEVSETQKLLGRHYQVRGSVVPGRNRGGRLLGFPTANIKIHNELCPATGVYAVTVGYGQTVYNGVANIGYSPTFADHTFTVEVHVLDFDKDIYGDCIRVNFIERLRGEKKFSGPEELAGQIRKDITRAKEILSS